MVGCNTCVFAATDRMVRWRAPAQQHGARISCTKQIVKRRNQGVSLVEARKAPGKSGGRERSESNGRNKGTEGRRNLGTTTWFKRPRAKFRNAWRAEVYSRKEKTRGFARVMEKEEKEVGKEKLGTKWNSRDLRTKEGSDCGQKPG